MPHRLQTRLMWSYLAVLLAGMAVAAALSWIAVEKLYLDSQRDNLRAQAELIAATLAGSPLPANPAEPYQQTANVAPGIHTRVLGQQGAVVVGLPVAAGNSQVQVPRAENAGAVAAQELLLRPEIQQALKGEAATAVRRVASAGNQRVLYAAAPIADAEGGLSGIVYLAMPLPAGGLPAGAVLQLGGAVAAAVLLAGAAGALLARGITRPLARLAQAAEAVSQGDLNAAVPAGSEIAEVRTLGAAFNAMTSSLRHSDQAKTAFLADVTHELRTPLTVIKGTIETLQDGALDDAKHRDGLLRSMEREADRLIRLVAQLLVLTRADAGALKLTLQPLDLAELARSRCERFAPLAARKAVTLVILGGASELPVAGDADRLAQVLDNLLDNAVRFAPVRSTIKVALDRDGGAAACSVVDAGPGIPREHLPFIFERFYRVDAARSRASGGAGLGLSIAHALVAAHGGRISAQSTEGQGTSITFSLPLAGTAGRLPAI